MNKIKSPAFLKLSIFLMLVLSIIGFFYFETSLSLRIIIVLLGIIGLLVINSFNEIVLLLTLYLGLYDLYNVHYWSGIPIAIVIIAVFLVVVLLFYVQIALSKLKEIIQKKYFAVYLLVIGLSIIEPFLAMDLWPTDPRTKSLILLLIFYLISKIIYFQGVNMLSFKKMIGFTIVSALIFVAIVLLSFRQVLGLQ